MSCLQPEIDEINSELLALESKISTIGLPTVSLGHSGSSIQSSNTNYLIGTATFNPGVYLVKVMAYASCSNTDGMYRLFSFFNRPSVGTNEQKQGLFLYAQHGAQQVEQITFQQQFIIDSTTSEVCSFYCLGTTYNGGNITYNGADYTNLGLGSPISIMQII